MVDAGRVRADADGAEHVADLRHGRVRDHALDVGLHEGDQAGHRERRGSDDRDEVGDIGRRGVDRPHAGDEVDAGRHHRGGVDQGGDRGRALHRVGQPRLQRQLRRLRDGAHEQQQRDPVGRVAADRDARATRLPEHRQVVGRVDVVPDHEDRERDPDVADGVHDERLLGGRDRRRALPPEADQEVGREPDHAPAGEQDDEVARQDEQQHREDEEVQVREEAAFLAVAVHVADRVRVDQEADPGDHEQHDAPRAGRRGSRRDVWKLPRREPVPARRELDALAGLVAEHRDERDAGRDEAAEDGPRGDDARRAARDRGADGDVEREPGERAPRSAEPRGVVQRVIRAGSAARRRRARPRRARARRSARGRRRPRLRRRPSRRARTPGRRCRPRSAMLAIRSRLPAFSMISIESRITSGLRRSITPISPTEKSAAESMIQLEMPGLTTDDLSPAGPDRSSSLDRAVAAVVLLGAEAGQRRARRRRPRRRAARSRRARTPAW